MEFSEKTMTIIREDVREIRSNGFKIASLSAKCMRMLDDPIRERAPSLLPDAEDWTETMTKILECCDQIHFIIVEKRGRF